MRTLLESVPTLLKAYGKWPSYFVVLLGTANGIAALVVVILLYHALK